MNSAIQTVLWTSVAIPVSALRVTNITYGMFLPTQDPNKLSSAQAGPKQTQQCWRR